MVHNPCLLLLLQLLLRIEAAKRGKEKERLTWSCYLKTKTMVMEGWLTDVTFFPDASVFRSLHLCSCFSLLVFSLSLCFFCFLLFSLSLSVLVPLGLSLYYLCLFISSVFFLYYLSVVLPFFVAFLCSSWFLWVCIWLVGSTTYGEGKLKFPFPWGRSQVSLSSLCLCFFPPASSSLCVVVFTGKRMPLHLSRDSVEISTVLSCLRKKNAHYWTVRGTLWRRDTG
jgi:hypothetical protein